MLAISVSKKRYLTLYFTATTTVVLFFLDMLQNIYQRFKRTFSLSYSLQFEFHSTYCSDFFKKNFLEDTSPFCGATDTPVLDFQWHLPWVSKPGWIPRLRASSPVHNACLRFISGATPADLLAASMTADHVPIHWSKTSQNQLKLVFN